MSGRPLSYKLLARDPHSEARAGQITTPHGTIQTPIFMPVGTQGAIRNLTPDQVAAEGAQIILANTYHLSIRPGEELVKKLGGLHTMMGYKVPILTDSGGFQVFSIPGKEIQYDGVLFPYEVNGQKVLITPERSMEIQQALGADIAMAFDECTPYPCTYAYAVEALERTTRWEKRSRAAHTRPDQALFGIVQGSVFKDLRQRSAREIQEIGFDGYAVGGLSVGEGLELMSRVLEYTVPELPQDQPRYLMGVGLPEDLIAGVERGIDMFDCVIPTRHARGGILYTFQGRIRIQHSRYRQDKYPIDTRCTCYTCRHFTRAYLRHLFMIREVLANTLASIHNIHFYLELMKRMREAILAGTFREFKRSFFEQYRVHDATPTKIALMAPGMEALDELAEYDAEEPLEDAPLAPRTEKRSNPGKAQAAGTRKETTPRASSPQRGSTPSGPAKPSAGRRTPAAKASPTTGTARPTTPARSKSNERPDKKKRR